MIDLDALEAHVTTALLGRGAKQRRGELWFLCPVHAERSPSAAYHLAKRTWYCQGCHAGGGIKDLAPLLGIQATGSFDPAIAARIESDRRAIMAADAEANALAAASLADYWAHLGASAALRRQLDTLDRLEREGICGRAVDHFGLGYSVYPVDGVGYPALAIPWMARGILRGVQYRLLADGVKGGRYRWHKGHTKTLYNADAVLCPCDDRMIIVEGAKKAMALWSAGVESVCALESKGAWDAKWARHMAPFDTVVFALDPDAGAEAEAAARTVPGARVARMPCKPDDLLVTTGGDVDALMAIIDAAHAVD